MQKTNIQFSINHIIIIKLWKIVIDLSSDTICINKTEEQIKLKTVMMDYNHYYSVMSANVPIFFCKVLWWIYKIMT